jgi:penicillin-binding protein 1C
MVLTKSYSRLFFAVAIAAVITAAWSIYTDILPPPALLQPPVLDGIKRQVLDRSGEPLTLTYASGWNTTRDLPLHSIPRLLQDACIEAEDKRFYEHNGVDWLARFSAAWQNVKAAHVVRGASTISEQVASMLHPRPRSIRTRIIEGLEAAAFEKRFGKSEILEFYLNQAPFAGNRRGVSQAARYFWNRDLDTLSDREQLALAVMLRAPERFNLFRNSAVADSRIDRLAKRLLQNGKITQEQFQEISTDSIIVGKERLPVQAEHFSRYVQNLAQSSSDYRPIHTTLDSGIQRKVQEIIDTRVSDLKAHNATDGAALVLDTRSGEVLAWVNAGGFNQEIVGQIDAILTPRQPGSTLKPLLYGLALSRGWTAASIIEDSPLSEAVGAGLHAYNNYSRVHYGPVTLRTALGNSLNIPAIRTIQKFGKESFIELLHAAGFSSLTKNSDFYGEGLALGNGEVTLLELTRAYLALARRGILSSVNIIKEDSKLRDIQTTTLFESEIADIINDILSDPQARRLEFGSDGLLNFPNQTAIKTGTSSDYRDAWAIGYSDNFTVGVWLGNLDYSSMSSISGARGPALALRSIFSELERGREQNRLYLSPKLLKRPICLKSGKLATQQCPSETEVFISGTAPVDTCALSHDEDTSITSENVLIRSQTPAWIELPTPGLNIAMDPRVPDYLEAFAFELKTTSPLSEVRWFVDGSQVFNGDGNNLRYLWSLQQGRHLISARVVLAVTQETLELGEVAIWVK